ncbi:hypothetical protein V6N12_048499 [Hibiscus sabdariffa]|uniref:Uncharacterized protein n=1 Tax=Hibiscus sabdariffa TaxID=183260 RepID=A0ABR2EHF5_9ROSI
MKNLVEATRVMERLDGFTLYGSRLSVKRAKENVEWERKRVLKPSVYKTGPPWSDKREEHIDGGFPGGSCQTQRKIEEVIEVEIGDIMFQVSVREVGFNDGTSYPLCNNGTKYMSESSDESTGGSKSDSGKRGDQESSDRSRPSLEEEAFQLRCKERDSINKGYRDEETIMGQNKDSELMGGEPNISSFTSDEGLEKGGDMEAVDLKEINEVNGNVCIDSFQEVSGGELGLDVGHLPMVGPELNRKEVDLVDTTKVELDLGKEVIKDGGFCVSPLVKNLTWADKVKLNAGNDGLRDSPEVGVSDVVLEGGIVEKCEDFKGSCYRVSLAVLLWVAGVARP